MIHSLWSGEADLLLRMTLPNELQNLCPSLPINDDRNTECKVYWFHVALFDGFFANRKQLGEQSAWKRKRSALGLQVYPLKKKWNTWSRFLLIHISMITYTVESYLFVDLNVCGLPKLYILLEQDFFV